MLGTKTRLAAVSLAVLGMTAITPPANAAPATLVSVGPGSLLADGASVDVPVTFICDTDPTRLIAVPIVEVNQRVSDGRIANGFGSKDTSCTKQEQTVTVRVVPRVMAYNPGTAVVTVMLQTCDVQFQCAAATFTTEIQLEESGGAQIPPAAPE